MMFRSPVLALAVALSPALVVTVADLPLAHAQDKDKSPAKREINVTEYQLKEVSRLRALSNFATNKNAQSMLEDNLKDVEGHIATIQKQDPKWDVSPYKQAVASAKAALEAAKKGEAAPATPTGPSGPNKAASAAFNDINMVEVGMKSITRKMDEAGWEKSSDKIRYLGTDLEDLQKRIQAVKKADSSWDVKPYEAFYKARYSTWQAADKASEAHSKDINDDVTRVGQFSSIDDRFGGSIAAGFRVVDKKPPSSVINIKTDLEKILGLAALSKECKDRNYPKVEAKFSGKPRDKQPKAVCAMADSYKDLAKQYVPLAAKLYLDTYLAEDKKSIDALSKDGWVTPSVDKNLNNVSIYSKDVAKAFANATSQAGATVAADYFKPLEANAAPYKTAFAAAGKKSRFPANMKLQDATATPPVQAAAQAMKAQIIQLRIAMSQWSISKNDIGIPKEKWNQGAVLVKVTGETACRLFPTLQFTAPYAGGGQYQKPYVNGISAEMRYQTAACQ